MTEQTQQQDDLDLEDDELEEDAVDAHINDEDDEEEEEEPPPPPRPRRPRQHAKPTRAQPPRGMLDDGGGFAQEESPLERMQSSDQEEVFPATPPWGDGLSPLEMVTPHHSAYLTVDRVEANGPSMGFEDGSDYVGPLGHVLHQPGFDLVVRRRFGGGKYRIRGVVKGKPLERPLVIGGASKDPEQQREEGEVDEPVGYGIPSYAPGYGQGGYGPGGYSSGPLPYGHGPAGYPSESGYGYGPGGYGPHAPPYPGRGSIAAAYRHIGDDEEEKELRGRLELAQEEARQAREDARVAEIRREAELREAQHRSEMDRILAEVRGSTRDDGSKSISEIIQAQMASNQQRLEEERQARAEKWEQELQARREERDREDRRRQEERERWERERRDRLDREERERLAREQARKEDADRAERERTRQDTAFQTMTALMTKGQMKPSEMLSMMASLKELSGPDDTVDKLASMVDAVTALKSLASDDDEDEGTIGKAKRFVQDAVTPAIGEVARIFRKDEQPPQAQPVAGAISGPVYQQPTGAIPIQEQVTPGTQQQTQAAPTGPPMSADEITPHQWGKILEYVVSARTAPPEEASAHFITWLRAIDAMPALDMIVTASVPVFKGKVNLLLATGEVTDQHFKDKMQEFVALCDTEQGEQWVDAFLGHTRVFYQAMQDQMRQQAAAAQAQQQAQQQAEVQQAKAQAAQAVPPPPPQVEPPPTSE